MTRPTLTRDEVQHIAANALARKRAGSRRPGDLPPDELAEVAEFYYRRAVALGHARPTGEGDTDGS
jgi:hypothetical protein